MRAQPFERSTRVAELIKAEIARILQVQLPPKEGEFISVVEVSINKDLSFAKVYLSIFSKEKIKALQLVKKNVGLFRKEIGRNLKLRIVPEIAFYLDESLENGDKVFQLLKDIKENKLPDDDL
ncbi:MAG: 30S ribosome-binding factor RbfA [Candidatus Margulisiibacteriota bacterium]|jgi:ribosome-binding factor A